MAKGLKLRDALDRHQGKDRTGDHKRQVQKNLQKEAEKKKKSKSKSKSIEEVLGAINDAGLEAGLADLDGDEDLINVDEEGWEDESDEDDEDDEDEPEYDLARLDESESDSDEDEEDEEVDGGEDLAATPNAAAPKSILKQTKTTPVTNKDKDEHEDEDEDEEDIPLSDIDEDAEGAEDIIPHQRLTINNTSALTAALNRIVLPISALPFSEHMTVITPDPISIPEIDDDLNRELAFYSQSLSAAQSARRLLAKENIPFTRPVDYFAEMVKSDEHMSKIKSRLVDEAASKKASAEARKQRDLKKFGKQVQQEKLKERAKDKREMLDKVNNLKRKRQGAGLDTEHEGDLFDVALEDAATTEKRDKEDRRAQGRSKGGPPNAKRAKKDSKFGFGGKKRFAKSNDARTSGDMSEYSAKKHKATKGGAATRPGKARRANAGR